MRSGLWATGISHSQNVATAQLQGAGETEISKVFAQSASILRILAYTTYESVSNSSLLRFVCIRYITKPEEVANLGKPDLDRSGDMGDSIYPPRFRK